MLRIDASENQLPYKRLAKEVDKAERAQKLK